MLAVTQHLRILSCKRVPILNIKATTNRTGVRMNKTLLASAILLALTSTAHSTEYLSGNGEALTVNNQETGIDRVLGGSTTTANYKTGSVTVNNGNLDMIAGGSYLS